MRVVEDHKMGDLRDQFPVGMRVLAVDDDRTCLMILETLLQRCQYHVTTAKNAITALKLLRENKNEFDLVISDVHMPDMDGFKLLELVGLEMDLPVIMLSANDDPKMVMKGITHGACDYLLKPVRIKELQIIWQHVIRRRKVNKTSNQDTPNSDSCNEQGYSAATTYSDQNEKPSKKRKDQDEDEDEENVNGIDNEDPTTQKRPRVVWSVELHRKFVAAVNQLGVDKAVPKKILDLMNVEKLTRENVASHLQKYRLYLKRISCVANQQANMVAALGSSAADPSYMRLGSLTGFGHLQTLSGPRQFHNNNTFRPFPPGGMISRLNTPASLNVHGLPSSSGALQLGQAQNLNNSTNDQIKFQPAIVRGGNQNGVKGMPMSIGLDQLQQHNKGISPIQDLTNKLPGYRPRVTIGSSPSPVLDVSNNALISKSCPLQDKQVGGAYKSSTSLASQHSQFSLPLLDNGRCNDIWSMAAMPPTDNMTCAPLQVGNLSGASSPITSLSGQPHDSLTNMHSQGVIFINTPVQVSSGNVPFQGWDSHNNQDGSYHSHVIGLDLAEGHTPINSTFNGTLDFSFCDPLQMKHDGMVELTEETSLKSNQLYMMNQQKSQSIGISNNPIPGSLEDLVSAMMKQKQDKVKLLDGYLYDNNYSGGTSL